MGKLGRQGSEVGVGLGAGWRTAAAPAARATRAPPRGRRRRRGLPRARRRTRRRRPWCRRPRRRPPRRPASRRPSQSAPLAPKVTSSERGTAPASASSAASCSLTTTGSASAIDVGRQGGIRRGVEHDARAAAGAPGARAGDDRPAGTSSCTSSTSPGPSVVDGRERALADAGRWRPATTTIVFSPSSSTTIRAVPVGCAGEDARSPRCRCRGRAAGRRRRVPASSSPDRPDHRRRRPRPPRPPRPGWRPCRRRAASRPVAEHGLAGLRVALDVGDEVDVERPEHEHPAHQRVLPGDACPATAAA